MTGSNQIRLVVGFSSRNMRPSSTCLRHPPLADLLQQSACLGSTHEQKNLPPDIVGVVLKDAPVAAIDALNEDQGLELIQLPLDFLLVGGLLKVPSGCIVDGRCRTKAKLAASSGDVGLSC